MCLELYFSMNRHTRSCHMKHFIERKRVIYFNNWRLTDSLHVSLGQYLKRDTYMYGVKIYMYIIYTTDILQIRLSFFFSLFSLLKLLKTDIICFTIHSRHLVGHCGCRQSNGFLYYPQCCVITWDKMYFSRQLYLKNNAAAL